MVLGMVELSALGFASFFFFSHFLFFSFSLLSSLALFLQDDSGQAGLT